MKRYRLILLALLFTLTGCVAPEVKPQEKKIPPTEVSLIAFGDYMVHRPQINAARRGEGFDFTEDFCYVKPFIDDADVAVINLETTLTDGKKGYTTFPMFASPIEIARDLKNVGFDVIATANNHAYDNLCTRRGDHLPRPYRGGYGCGGHRRSGSEAPHKNGKQH